MKTKMIANIYDTNSIVYIEILQMSHRFPFHVYTLKVLKRSSSCHLLDCICKLFAVYIYLCSFECIYLIAVEMFDPIYLYEMY